MSVTIKNPESLKKRLVKILKNIIENKRTFKPV